MSLVSWLNEGNITTYEIIFTGTFDQMFREWEPRAVEETGLLVRATSSLGFRNERHTQRGITEERIEHRWWYRRSSEFFYLISSRRKRSRRDKENPARLPIIIRPACANI